jgi:hypothetical protein
MTLTPPTPQRPSCPTPPPPLQPTWEALPLMARHQAVRLLAQMLRACLDRRHAAPMPEEAAHER